MSFLRRRSAALLTTFARPVTLTPPLLWLVLSGTGCKGCDRDRPYVPITLGATSGATSNAGSPSVAAPVGSLAVDGGTFARVLAVRPPPGSTTWTLDGLTLVAPPGRVFLAGLVFTPPGGARSAAAVVGDGGSMAGEVVVFRPDAGGRLAPTTLSSFPAWLPVGQGCAHAASLAQVGPNTLFADVSSTCERPDLTKASRWLSAISMTASPAVRTELRALPSAPGELLRADADASDRDNDGQDDLVVQLTLETSTPGGPPAAESHASVSLKYLDRATGMSRESEDLPASLKAMAAWVGGQAIRAGSATAAAKGAITFRKLFRALCSEGGSPSILAGDGSVIACHDTSSLEDARFAEARAAMSLNELPRAFAMGGRLAEGGPSRRAADLDKALASVAKVVKAKAVPLKAQPVAWSVALPLAFQSDGSLLIRTTDGIVRVDPAGGESVAQGAPSWSPAAELAGDLRVTGANDPCTSGSIELLVTSSGGRQPRLTSTPGGSSPRCSATGPAVLLLDRNADGLVALVQGDAVSVSADGDKVAAVPFPAGPGAPGSIRSPDGASLALADPDKVLVMTAGKAELWKPSPHFTLSACTVSNGARAVACVLEHGVVLITP